MGCNESRPINDPIPVTPKETAYVEKRDREEDEE